MFYVAQGVQRPSSENVDGVTDRATWYIANKNSLYVLPNYLPRPVQYSRSVAGLKSQDGPGHRQQAWAALCEKFHGCLREALRTEHHDAKTGERCTCPVVVLWVDIVDYHLCLLQPFSYCFCYCRDVVSWRLILALVSEPFILATISSPLMFFWTKEARYKYKRGSRMWYHTAS